MITKVAKVIFLIFVFDFLCCWVFYNRGALDDMFGRGRKEVGPVLTDSYRKALDEGSDSDLDLLNSLLTDKRTTQGEIQSRVKTKKEKKWKKKKTKTRRVNFGNLDRWLDEPGYKKVLLWTGYGPPHEENSLWTRVFGQILSGHCPESRCTFTTNKSLEHQQNADATIFHMPNFHWEVRHQYYNYR